MVERGRKRERKLERERERERERKRERGEAGPRGKLGDGLGISYKMYSKAGEARGSW